MFPGTFPNESETLGLDETWTYLRPGFSLEVCPQPIFAFRSSLSQRGQVEIFRVAPDSSAVLEFLSAKDLEAEIARANLPWKRR